MFFLRVRALKPAPKGFWSGALSARVFMCVSLGSTVPFFTSNKLESLTRASNDVNFREDALENHGSNFDGLLKLNLNDNNYMI